MLLLINNSSFFAVLLSLPAHSNVIIFGAHKNPIFYLFIFQKYLVRFMIFYLFRVYAEKVLNYEMANNKMYENRKDYGFDSYENQ